ncbi:MAG: bifunctional (p)ppGpp synthetase/guanosine-3',5'-bis(diphosphate) 3'-pyrophosphohydrolase [Peptococcaceae bacterium]|nr:bifunctional (p)ppGpp synthetase/guanosine-3',5'-bis(diphosphate) 3'-pyrophosphohydrolase [Peptococcaceae bacterium]
MHYEERQLLHKAIQFATEAHQGQKRKGSGLDYICHPLEVLQILTQCDASLPVLIAGVLHDTIEDTTVTARQIHDTFGPQVTALVLHHSEDKGKTWKERKTAAIHEAQTGTLDCKLLIAADKVSNLRSTAADHKRLGENLWQLFSAGRDEIRWYYHSMLDALQELKHHPHSADLYAEMEQLYHEIFTPVKVSTAT